ncbi:hypothetical protein MPH_04051 [Macrophomina phaseolina MS6]|uniref:Rhodopsin domain-containing protein n=2 Tax=Macrophomina phaseolina TaxID=35725 RepID=K2SPJ7_MACPH|nr:hypothetical protein MPH_04051 [Macrophomina phaseolina MS6]
MFLTDLAILVLPMPLLWKLNMKTGKKIAMVLIFGSGLIACISPMVRFSTLHYVTTGSFDITYSSTTSLYWMSIEFNLGLVAGSLSSLRALPIFRGIRSTFSNYVKSDVYINSRSIEMDPLGSSSQHRRKKRRTRPMGESVLEETVNISEERILAK